MSKVMPTMEQIAMSKILSQFLVCPESCVVELEKQMNEDPSSRIAEEYIPKIFFSVANYQTRSGANIQESPIYIRVSNRSEVGRSSGCAAFDSRGMDPKDFGSK